MQLLYTFIRRSDCLENIGFNFSPYYDISFNPETKTLSIIENKNFPRSFFPESIVSISAIVGNNGAGKSTTCRWILNAIVEGSAEKEPNGIIVFKSDEERFMIYVAKEYLPIKIDSASKIRIQIISNLLDPINAKISCTYYSGHFAPYMVLNVTEGELAGEINISDSWMLLKDLQTYGNIDTHHLGHPIGEHLNAYYIQNTLRIARMLLWTPLRKELSKLMRVPNFIVFTPSISGKTRINKDSTIGNNTRRALFNHAIKYAEARHNELDRYIEEGLLNYIADQGGSIANLIGIPLEWLDFTRSEMGPIEDFRRFMSTRHKEGYIPGNLLKLIELLNSECEFYNENGIRFFYVGIDKCTMLVDELTSILLEPSMISARFFEMSYTIDFQYGLSKLSSGETQMLNLLSRIYWHMTIDSRKFANLEVTPLIILDEAEIGFHPEWQQKYINTLSFFFSKLADFLRVRYNAIVRFQIIYTTHSPISLSDMPKECVNFLEAPIDKDGKMSKTMNLRQSMSQTFGENVFELYRNSFFMKDGLVGKKAHDYITQIDRILENEKGIPENMDEIENQISIIGDDRIRTFFMDKLQKRKNVKDIDSRIELLSKEIERLREMKVERLKYLDNE